MKQKTKIEMFKIGAIILIAAVLLFQVAPGLIESPYNGF